MLLQYLLVSVRFLKTLNSMFLSVDFLPKLSCLLHASILVYVTFSNPVWFYEHVALHACDKEEETVTNQKKKKKSCLLSLEREFIKKLKHTISKSISHINVFHKIHLVLCVA